VIALNKALYANCEMSTKAGAFHGVDVLALRAQLAQGENYDENEDY
jgi:hypothetical protein